MCLLGRDVDADAVDALNFTGRGRGSGRVQKSTASASIFFLFRTGGFVRLSLTLLQNFFVDDRVSRALIVWGTVKPDLTSTATYPSYIFLFSI